MRARRRRTAGSRGGGRRVARAEAGEESFGEVERVGDADEHQPRLRQRGPLKHRVQHLLLDAALRPQQLVELIEDEHRHLVAPLLAARLRLLRAAPRPLRRLARLRAAAAAATGRRGVALADEAAAEQGAHVGALLGVDAEELGERGAVERARLAELEGVEDRRAHDDTAAPAAAVAVPCFARRVARTWRAVSDLPRPGLPEMYMPAPRRRAIRSSQKAAMWSRCPTRQSSVSGTDARWS